MVDGPYEKFVIKLWDTIVDKGVCGVFRSGQIKREGLANVQVARAQILMLAQAGKEAEEIKSGKKIARIEKGELILINNAEAYEPILDLPSMYAAIKEDIVIKSVQEEINVAKTLLKAEQELIGQKGEVSEDEVDIDWVNRWRDYVQKISSEEIQSLWAKLLAGEVKSPGRYSYRTMEFLKNLTKQEAREIENIIPFMFKEGFIYRGYLEAKSDGGTHRKIHNWLSWETLYRMQELGLIHSVHEDGVTVNISSVPGEKFFLRGVSKVIVYEFPVGRSCNEPYIPITRLGVELMDIAGGQSNMEYVVNFAERIKHCGGNVQLADYKERSDGTIECFNVKQI